MLRRIIGGILRLIIIVIGGVIAVISIIIFLFLMWILNLPQKLAKYINLDKYYRYILYQMTSPEDLHYFREEYLEVIQSKVEYKMDLSRWGLVQEIEFHKDGAISDLRTGENLTGIIGGFAAIIFGNVFGLAIGGLILTIFAVAYSIIVSIRILVVDHLAYSGFKNRHAPMRELKKMKIWNEGPLRGGIGVGMIFVTIISSKGSDSMDWAMHFLDKYTDSKFNYNKKWEIDDES